MRKTTILFNCTTNVVGGGVKNSAIFIKNAINYSEVNWYFAISKEVLEILENENIKLSDKFKLFENSPARNIAMRKELIAYCAKIKPNIIYTMAGPAYVKFKEYHVMGISSPYMTHAKFLQFKLSGNCHEIIKKTLSTGFKMFKSLSANHYVFQTNEARIGFSKRMKIPDFKTSVISNAVDEKMLSQLSKLITNNKEEKVISIFCPGAAYAHKGFQFIPEIAKHLEELVSDEFKFIITLPESSLLRDINLKSKKFGVEKHINNIGPYKYSNVAKLYSKANIVFVPSLLETFSASYLEAMAAQKILIVADKGFAKEVCGHAAAYVNPLNSKEAAEMLAKAIESPSQFDYQGIHRIVQLEKFGNQKKRFRKIEKLLLEKAEKL